MKNMKKLASLLLALVMVFALATTVSAEETTYTLTINNSTSGHTYEAYQIFAGDLDVKVQGETTTKTLSNIVWGNGITEAGQTALLSFDKNEGQEAYASAADLADALTSENVAAFAKAAAQYLSSTSGTFSNIDGYKITGLTAGYYLVKDQDGILSGKDDAYTSYILEVIADETVTPKSAKPTVDKQVWDEDSDDDEELDENWGETADHDLNETFQFKLIASLPADTDFVAYETYKVIFHDTMSAGVTFEEIVSVTVDGVAVTDYTCTAAADQAGESWTLTIADIKTVHGVDLSDGAEIVVIYDAHLNENAVIGNQDDNLNTVYLEYSNNPNASGSGNNHETGNTTTDTVWVFTYELDVTKVDGANNSALKDAQFVLYRKVARTVTEGDTAVTSPAEVTEYVIVDETGKVTGWTEDVTKATTFTTGDDGKIAIIGLDHGTYYLEETKAPSGYNKLADPIEVVISAVHTETADTVSATTTYTVNEGTGITVENNAGTELPETGGMGTTLFYAMGSLLAVSAVILLITKKRVGTEF